MKDMIQRLVKIANQCDQQGFRKEADQVDYIIQRLAQKAIGEPFYENGVQMQRYIDRDGKLITRPLQAEQPREKGVLESGYEWLSDQVQKGMKGMLGSGVKGIGHMTGSPESGEKASEFFGFENQSYDPLSSGEKGKYDLRIRVEQDGETLKESSHSFEEPGVLEANVHYALTTKLSDYETSVVDEDSKGPIYRATVRAEKGPRVVTLELSSPQPLTSYMPSLNLSSLFES